LGLRFDAGEKPGQLAHLDQDRKNHSIENLAWLCLFHHDQYDSRSSQSKGLTIAEVKAHRTRLYDLVAARAASLSPEARGSIKSDETNDAVLQIVERYRFVRAEQIDTVQDEILTRFRKIHGFCTALSREYDRMNSRDPAASDSEYDWAYDHLKQQFDLPDGIYGLHPEGEFDKNGRQT
jgi:hypothetical protein